MQAADVVEDNTKRQAADAGLVGLAMHDFGVGEFTHLYTDLS